MLQIFLYAFPVLASTKTQGIHNSLILLLLQLEGTGGVSLQAPLLLHISTVTPLQVCADKIEGKERRLPTIGTSIVLPQGSECIVKNGFLSWIVMGGREFVCS